MPLFNHSRDHGGSPGEIPAGGGALEGRSGAMSNPAAGCTLDGIWVPCDMAFRAAGSGAATVVSVSEAARIALARTAVWVEGDTSETTVDPNSRIPTIRATGGHFEWSADADSLGNSISMRPQKTYPFLGNNPFPELAGRNLKEATDALNGAKDVTSQRECDEALKDKGIPSLAALVNQMKINGNIYDGRSSTIGLIPPSKHSPRPTIASRFKENRDSIGAEVQYGLFTGRSEDTLFLNDYFFNPQGSFYEEQRTLILIHEAVHQFGDKTDQDFGTSAKLTQRIAEKCFPGLAAAKQLGNLVL